MLSLAMSFGLASGSQQLEKRLHDWASLLLAAVRFPGEYSQVRIMRVTVVIPDYLGLPAASQSPDT